MLPPAVRANSNPTPAPDNEPTHAPTYPPAKKPVSVRLQGRSCKGPSDATSGRGRGLWYGFICIKRLYPNVRMARQTDLVPTLRVGTHVRDAPRRKGWLRR